MFANQHIFNGAHVCKQADILEGAGNSEGCDFEWLEFCDVGAVKRQLSTGNLVNACHRVKEGRFACTVWTDQTGDHSLFDNEINTINGDKTTEDFSNFESFKECQSYLPLLRIAALKGRRSRSGRGGFIFISMQLFTNLPAGEQPFRSHRHHNNKRQAEQQEAIQDWVCVLFHNVLQGMIVREGRKDGVFKQPRQEILQGRQKKAISGRERKSAHDDTIYIAQATQDYTA